MKQWRRRLGERGGLNGNRLIDAWAAARDASAELVLGGSTPPPLSHTVGVPQKPPTNLCYKQLAWSSKGDNRMRERLMPEVLQCSGVVFDEELHAARSTAQLQNVVRYASMIKKADVACLNRAHRCY